MLIGVMAFACLIRIGVIWKMNEHLLDDRDAYLALARGVVKGEGLANPGSGGATAFRPPLYPLLLAGVSLLSGWKAAVALINLVAGTVSVWLTYRIGFRFDGWWTGLAAATVVAGDPLLVYYTGFPMTETIFTFLVLALLAIVQKTAVESADKPQQQESGLQHQSRGPLRPMTPQRQIAGGIVFGLAALCRPTILAVVPLVACWWLFDVRRASNQAASDSKLSMIVRVVPWMLVLAAGLTIAGWPLRNQLALGHPIVTTTHGGYTVLLGNNPMFYRQVVARPWGTVWDDTAGSESQSAWFALLQYDMAQDGVRGEVARDRWHYRRAYQNIVREPAMFLRSCLLRFRRFWSVAPTGSAGDVMPRALAITVCCFYSALFVACGIGCFRLSKSEWNRWLPLLLVVAAICSVHLVYWSNTRMRAPVMPIVALLAARGVRPARPSDSGNAL